MSLRGMVFVLHIVLLLVLEWMTLLLFKSALIVVPISLGRALFSAIPRFPIAHDRKCNDLYAFNIGCYIIWTTVAVAKYSIEYVKTRRAADLAAQIWKWCIIVLKSSVLLSIWVNIYHPDADWFVVRVVGDCANASARGRKAGFPPVLGLGTRAHISKIWTRLMVVFNFGFLPVHQEGLASSFRYFSVVPAEGLAVGAWQNVNSIISRGFVKKGIRVAEDVPRQYEMVWNCKHCSQGQMEKEKANLVPFPEVVIGDLELLEKKKAAIRSAGPSKLQVIADFDATLTKYWVNGRRGNSSHGLLQQGNPKYDRKRQELFEYYHPLEFSPTIPIEEKTKLMEEWWGKTHALLIEGGLTYDAIKTSVADAVIAFREGVAELFEFLEERDVPVLIFSAGLADIIEEVLRQKLHRSFKNVRVVSNRMEFDDGGHLVAFKGKTIHVLNKNEHALDMAAPVHDQLGDTDEPNDDNASVKMRTNVLLLGDHLGDLRMSDGLNYENRIAVGFLNNNIEKSLETYREAFDIVYLDDAPMSGVVDLVCQLCSTD